MKRKIIAALTAIAAACSVQPAAAETVTLKFGQIPSTVHTVTSLYLFVAEKKGYLAREDIKLQFVPIAGGTDKMVAAVVRGTVDVAHTSTPYLISAVLAGSPSVAIAGEVANPVYSLMVRPEIASYADLKGKTIGLSIAADTISISMRKLLALKGLGEHDYAVKELVGTPVRFDCLERGECAGVPLGQPNDFEAIKQGFRRLGDSTEAVPALQFQVIAARHDWAETHKDTVTRFLRALASSFQFIRDPANRQEVLRLVVEHTGSSEEIARNVIALYFEPEKGVMPKRGEIDLKGLAQVIAFMGEAGSIKPPLPPVEKFIDLQYLRAVGVE